MRSSKDMDHIRKKKDIEEIYHILLEEYGHQGWWPHLSCDGINPTKSGSINGYHPNDYSYPKNGNEKFEIIVGSILTQNTAWPNVEKALLNLKRENLLTPKKILECNEFIIKEAIHPAGYFNQKYNYLKNISEFFLSLNSRTPSRTELLDVKGIGKESADTILLYAFKIPSFIIDAYTKRISEFLEISDNLEYEFLRKIFEESIPKDFRVYQEFHALLVEHAKRYYSRKPYGERDRLLT